MSGNAGSGGASDRIRDILARRGVVPLVGGLGAILVIGVVIVVAAGGGGGSNARVSPTAPPAESAGLAKTPEAVSTPAPTPDLSQATTVVTKTAGSAIPGGDSADRIVIGKANINAPITLRVVPAEGGYLASPNGPNDVVFYDFSNWPGIGGYPGIGGTAIFSGHVDYHDCGQGVPCTAVFWDLDKLTPGDTIEVRVKGTTFTYRVTGSLDMAADDADTWDRVIKSSAKEGITLVTCGGDFNRTTREYDKRHIVTGERV
jgi:LPXTG-site transpeptidase (sortase) family protein